MPGRNTATTKKIIGSVVFYAALLLAWQGLYVLGSRVFGWWKPYAFPNPVGVWESLLLMIERDSLFNAVFYSMRRAVIGYLLSIVIGAFIGVVMAKFRGFRDIVKPVILGIQTLPSVCWVPFALLWFGLKEGAIIFVIIAGSAFSVALSVDSAIRNVNPLYIKAAKTMGADERELYFKVILPASLPALITGLKQGWSFAWRALMSAEVMSASIGLGQALMMGRDLADINRVMLIMIIIVLVGGLIDRLVFSLAEERIQRRIGL